MKHSVKLQLESLLQVPLDKYEKDFTFIVNGKSFKTSKFIADLLSSKISNIHSKDPTIDTFSFNTQAEGDFQRFLSLIDFKNEELAENEINFFIEILEQLGTEKVEVNSVEISIDNVIENLKETAISRNLYEYRCKIDFLSKNFYKICEKNSEKIFDLSVVTFQDILKNENLQIESEDQLLTFVNKLYSKSKEYVVLYECVCFANVSVDCIESFLSVFDFKDMNEGIWLSLSKRLKQQVINKTNEKLQPTSVKVQSNENFQNKKSEIKNNEKSENNEIKESKNNENNTNNEINKIKNDENCTNNEIKNDENCTSNEINESKNNENNNIDLNHTGFNEISYSNEDFNGIFNFLQKKSNIDEEVKLTFSSFNYGQPENLIQYDNKDFFGTGNKLNSWICFEFKKRLVIPTCYTIKSCDFGEKWLHPKSWVIEGSMNSMEWETIDKQNECSLLRGPNIVHTFQIQNENHKEFKFLRIRQTDHNWKNNNCLYINSIEFYGLIN